MMRNFTNLKIYLLGLTFILIGFLSYGQGITVKGKVTESAALPWATVLQKGTVTDMGGINPTGLNRKNIMIYMYAII